MTDESNRYDLVPYLGGPIESTRLDRLEAMGVLFGLAPAAATRSRVLEIGCGTGNNLIAMAYALPQSEFVGIDYSRRQIEIGASLARELGLENIQLNAVDIREAGESLDTFDYIICHGVFSWVPPDVREIILTLCRQHLTEHGIAYISYNTYPGWAAARSTMRLLLLRHVEGLADSQTKIEAAADLVRRLAGSAETEDPMHKRMQGLATELMRYPSAYLFHEYLEPTNQALYFREFIELASAHDLAYIGEPELCRMTLNRNPELQQSARQIFGDDLLQLEQYADYLVNRTMRWTLLCRAQANIRRDGLAERLDGLYFAAVFIPRDDHCDLKAGVKQQFTSREQADATIVTDESHLKAVLVVLAEAYPVHLDLGTLHERTSSLLARSGGQTAPTREELRRALLDWLRMGLLSMHGSGPRVVGDVSDRPLASALARLLASRGERVASLIHRGLTLDDAGRQILQALDGTRDSAAVIDHLTGLAESGGITITGPDGKRATDRALIRRAVTKSVESALPQFAKLGLLQA